MNISEAIKRCAEEVIDNKMPCDISTGEVKSVNPLTIRTGGLLLGEDILLLTDAVKRKTTTVSIAGYSREIVLRDDLKTGERVLLIRAGGAARYAVIARIGGESDASR